LVFEFNHVSGRANSPVGRPLCKNCHAKLSDKQRDLPQGMLDHTEKTPAETLAAILLGLAILIEQCAEFVVATLRAYGLWLYENSAQVTMPGLPVFDPS